jgi:hypothetical protein
MTARAWLDEWGEDWGLLIADGFDAAILGVSDPCPSREACVVYDREQVIAILAEQMSHEEAEEYFVFNVVGAWVGPNTPIFVTLAPGGTRPMAREEEMRRDVRQLLDGHHAALESGQLNEARLVADEMARRLHLAVNIVDRAQVQAQALNEMILRLTSQGGG